MSHTVTQKGSKITDAMKYEHNFLSVDMQAAICHIIISSVQRKTNT